MLINDLNHLGHEFIMIWKNEIILHCKKCNCNCFRIMYPNNTIWSYFQKIKTGAFYGDYIPLLTCDEMIIKNIIE